MNKVQSIKQNTKPSLNNPFDNLKGNPNIKKSAKDYGKATVNALKRDK